ncbi:unnamed protein product [Prorocentrum cordatum]|uniref:RING-type domain-containing protein n=1 Tax=Prorocentrum cordatum TaxID=2364126 RepID=A0ABN9UBB9_9DINO|nr:unnamed protein product [Polarella glacialis]
MQRAFDGTRCSLLKFCSHHCLGGDAEGEVTGGDAEAPGGEEPGGASARGSVERMGDRKRRERSKQQDAVRAEYRVLAALTSGLAGHGDTKAEAEGSARLREVEARARGLGSTELAALLASLPAGGVAGDAAGLARAALQAPPPAGCSCSAVLQLLSRGGCRQLAPLRAARAGQLARCAAALARLVAAERSLRFFEATLRVLSGAESGTEGSPECSVCLEPLSPAGAAVLPCAHAFHTGCCFALLAGQGPGACPACRAPFGRADVAPVGAAEGPAPCREAELHGSKLAAVGQVLRKIQGEDPIRQSDRLRPVGRPGEARRGGPEPHGHRARQAEGEHGPTEQGGGGVPRAGRAACAPPVDGELRVGREPDASQPRAAGASDAGGARVDAARGAAL